jgi:hypothetical protein
VILFVIPGRPQGEPGIHFSAEHAAQWIPGLRASRAPGMTADVAGSVSLRIMQRFIRPFGEVVSASATDLRATLSREIKTGELLRALIVVGPNKQRHAFQCANLSRLPTMAETA